MLRPSIYFSTLGCPKNEADTDHMKSLVQLAGYVLADNSDEADVVVVNTCSFLTEASEESIDAIFELLGSSRDETPKLVVSGCLPSRYGSDLSKELTEAAAFLPCDEEEHIVEVVSRLTGVPPREGYLGSETSRTQGSASAYVKISDGCDRWCSFCAIPAIRGRYFSRGYEDIESEVDSLAAGGAREVVLVGQDTSVWGCDLEGHQNLSGLLDRLATRFPDIWLRVLYLQPEGVTDELLDVIASHGNLCDYLDIPLQHVSSRVLSEMNRRGSYDEFLGLVRHIRSRIPDVRLRTTYLCGFPGETERDFDELCDFAREAAFDYAGVFPYSQEAGTMAGERSDQIPVEVRVARANRLREICEQTGFARTAGHVGEEHLVLFEGYEETTSGVEAVGRFFGQAPDIDGCVHAGGRDVVVGSIRRVRFTDSFCYEYEGELVS